MRSLRYPTEQETAIGTCFAIPVSRSNRKSSAPAQIVLEYGSCPIRGASAHQIDEIYRMRFDRLKLRYVVREQGRQHHVIDFVAYMSWSWMWRPKRSTASRINSTITNGLLIKATIGVLVSLRGSTCGREYDSPLRSQRHYWMASLNGLRGISQTFVTSGRAPFPSSFLGLLTQC